MQFLCSILQEMRIFGILLLSENMKTQKHIIVQQKSKSATIKKERENLFHLRQNIHGSTWTLNLKMIQWHMICWLWPANTLPSKAFISPNLHFLCPHRCLSVHHCDWLKTSIFPGTHDSAEVSCLVRDFMMPLNMGQCPSSLTSKFKDIKHLTFVKCTYFWKVGIQSKLSL